MNLPLVVDPPEQLLRLAGQGQWRERGDEDESAEHLAGMLPEEA